MTAGRLAWWNAAMAQSQFADGSLVIDDDTLDVNGGSSVNLRVKLGARPRSDVTVALAETSARISLGSSSLTFTQENWDTFQSVAVTAAGNRQAFTLPSGDWVGSLTTNHGWSGLGIPVDAGLRSSSYPNADLHEIAASPEAIAGAPDGYFNLGLGQFNRQDLSDAFEASGFIDLSSAAGAVTVAMAGADTTEPYQFAPSNLTEVLDFFGDTHGLGSGNRDGTAVFRDYAPGSAAISLSASGPDEYAGKTGSATVTVN